MKNSNVIGIDLAKNVMQVCIIDKHGELLSNKAISPSKLKILLANNIQSIVAMEACGACHYWARLAQKYGHDVRVISPKKIKAFLQGLWIQLAVATLWLNRFAGVSNSDVSPGRS